MESVIGFGNMNATANSEEMYGKGIDARVFSRANDRRRGGFLESQGGGTIRKKTVTRKGQTYTYWEARLTVGRDPGTGKQVQRSITGKTQKEVAQKLKAATAAIDSNAADKDAAIKAAVSAIDSAKSKGVIHKNTAARKVSRMAKRANKAAAQ